MLLHFCLIFVRLSIEYANEFVDLQKKMSYVCCGFDNGILREECYVYI